MTTFGFVVGIILYIQKTPFMLLTVKMSKRKNPVVTPYPVFRVEL